MFTSLATFLGLVVLLGIWHAVLVALGGEPPWARTVLRVVIAGTTLIQAVAYTVVTGMTTNVSMDDLNHTLNRVSAWTRWSDGSCAAMLGVGGLVLLGLTVRRALKGPIAPREPSAP